MRISDWSSDVCSSDLFADAVQPCHLGTGLATGGDGFGDFATLLVAELAPSSADPPFGTRLGKAGAGAFAAHGPLALGEASHHLHHHPPCRAGGRSEERRGGKGCVSTFSSRWSP